MTTFVDNSTVIQAVWLNSVDRAVTQAIGTGTNAPTTPAEVKVNLGLDQVNNTSDVNKPISTATQTALNGKQDSLPSQSGHATHYLQTDGTNVSWTEVDALPAQATHAGEFLTTNGVDASWVEVQSNSTPFGLFEHAHTISADYTIATGNNAISGGPVTIDSGVTVTVPSGSTWTIV